MIPESELTDHAWLKVKLNANRSESKYREFSARNYSEFNVNELRLIENKLEHNQDLDVSVRANKFIDIITDTLDVTAPRKKFRIPRVWDGKNGSQMR